MVFSRSKTLMESILIFNLIIQLNFVKVLELRNIYYKFN